MTDEQKEKMLSGRLEKNNNRTYIEIDDIIIKSYEHGWILKIGSEGDRYYSSLLPLFKKLYMIKLSRIDIQSITAMGNKIETGFIELFEMVKRLESKL